MIFNPSEPDRLGGQRSNTPRLNPDGPRACNILKLIEYSFERVCVCEFVSLCVMYAQVHVEWLKCENVINDDCITDCDPR